MVSFGLALHLLESGRHFCQGEIGTCSESILLAAGGLVRVVGLMFNNKVKTLAGFQYDLEL